VEISELPKAFALLQEQHSPCVLLTPPPIC
jgi:hypothetical protein